MDYFDRNREEEGKCYRASRMLQPPCRETSPLTRGSPRPKGKWAGLQHFRNTGSKVQTELKFKK